MVAKLFQALALEILLQQANGGPSTRNIGPGKRSGLRMMDAMGGIKESDINDKVLIDVVDI